MKYKVQPENITKNAIYILASILDYSLKKDSIYKEEIRI